MYKYLIFLTLFCHSLSGCQAKINITALIAQTTFPYAELNNGKLEGFAVDIIEEISKIADFNHTMELLQGHANGISIHINDTQMIDQVIFNRSEIAFVDLPISDDRKNILDFTEPYLETGLAILIHKIDANIINSFGDLANQTLIPYGMVQNSATHAFFSQSNDSTIQKMYQHMQNNPSLYINKLIVGVKRVKTMPFALITERAFAEMIAGKDCDLTYIVYESNLFLRQYAIAVPKNSVYLDKLNSAISDLKSNGLMDVLNNRYWKNCGVLTGVTIRKWPLADMLFGGLRGLVVDLMNRILWFSDINYSLYFTPDNKYGTAHGNNIDGMLGEVYNNRADFAIADITITDVRKQFVDFTEPFLETRLAILIHKNNTNNISSFWDLTQQSVIKYGTIRNGSTYYLFKYSNDTILQEMYRKMAADPEVLMKNIKEGVYKVKTSSFGFIVEKVFAELFIGDNCDLTLIEDRSILTTRQFAIALPKNSPHLSKFNWMIKERNKEAKWANRLLFRYRKECGVLKGVTIRNPPYAELFWNKDGSGSIKGFVVDLINEMATISGFTYVLHLAIDGKYGFVQNNSVNGIVGEVHQKLADFAIADLRVTEERKQLVDFTESFEETGLAILIHKNNANNITSFRDLVRQTDVKYSTFGKGFIYKEFAQSSDPTIAQIYRTMSESPELFVTSLMDGIIRVNTTRFAVIVERPHAQYISEYYCDQLTYIVDPEYPFPLHFAIALPKNSTHLQEFNTAIRQLKTSGRIAALRAKYWTSCPDNFVETFNNLTNTE